MTYTAPERELKAFTCPHCGVFARQSHFSTDKAFGKRGYADNNLLASSICQHCDEATLWHDNKMIYPNRGNAPLPHSDMPDDVMTDYQEAATIAHTSPKAAAALLRLATQKLCIHLGGQGKNINTDIATLVQKGLSPTVQQSLDLLRVIGNNAVHPGQIDTDNAEVVGSLFQLLNLITEAMISTPTKINTLFGNLPQPTLDAIAKRDSNA